MKTANVRGWERTLSVAVGIIGIGNGIKRGGVTGLLEAGVSLMALKRGLTGHCQLKEALAEGELTKSLPHKWQPTYTARREETKVDNALEETFPASDPISP